MDLEKPTPLPAPTAGQAGVRPASAPAPAPTPAPTSGDIRRQDQTRRVAEEFEALFLSQMLEPMFAGLQTEGPFGGGAGEQIYQTLMVQEYGKAIAASGGVGIADAVQREILKLQEIE